MRRRIAYITGSRADFGLMGRTLQRVREHPALELGICVTGMHLDAAYGGTIADIERANLPIQARIPATMSGSGGAEMALALADMLRGFVQALGKFSPAVTVVLGDRGEMLAGALASLHLNIPIMHIHGGERSGTIDESLRHAISKLSHLHCTATTNARERLIRMGEDPARVFVTGAPGLDGLRVDARRAPAELCAAYGFDPAAAVTLLVYHPVVQDAVKESDRMEAVLAGVANAGGQVLCLLPNADAGATGIRAAIAARATGALRVEAHLSREDYVSWLAAADVLVGNSSSGIIEAASFGLPVVNIGDRQNGRERSANVTDVPPEASAVAAAIRDARTRGRQLCRNVYGDGRAGERIVDLLATADLSPTILKKLNAY